MVSPGKIQQSLKICEEVYESASMRDDLQCQCMAMIFQARDMVTLEYFERVC